METERAEKLIELIKCKPIIWNLKHPKYASNKKKAEAWKYVSATLGVTVYNAKKKWKGLRDSYIRELHKQERNSEKSADEAENSWKYRKSMDFLRGHMRPKSGDFKHTPTIEDIFDEESDDSFSTKPFKAIEEEVWPFTTIHSKPNLNFMDESSVLSPPPSKKHKPNVDQSLLSTMKSIHELLSQSRQSILEQTASAPNALNFEDDLYCRSLGEKMSKFPLKKKNEAKIEMMRYLCEIEEELNTTSN